MSKKARKQTEDEQRKTKGEAPRAEQTELHSTEEMAGKQGHTAYFP